MKLIQNTRGLPEQRKKLTNRQPGAHKSLCKRISKQMRPYKIKEVIEQNFNLEIPNAENNTAQKLHIRFKTRKQM